jgi:ribonuclease HI
MRKLTIYIDGASKGNPGPSGIGVVVCSGKETIKNISSYIGNSTNNAAEYTALIYALQEALKLKAQSLEINTDSQLLSRQLNRVYKVKNPNIAGLYNQVLHLKEGFKEVVIINIPREQNRGADKLANQAIKEQFKNKSSLVIGRAEGGRSAYAGRKVRAPEDNVVGNAHLQREFF